MANDIKVVPVTETLQGVKRFGIQLHHANGMWRWVLSEPADPLRVLEEQGYDTIEEARAHAENLSRFTFEEIRIVDRRK